MRCAVIIISDGGYNRSRYKLRETKLFLEEADVPVFAVMAGPSFELPEIFTRRENKPNPFPGSQKKNTPLDNLPFQLPREEYIGPAELRGPPHLKELTEVTGRRFFTSHNFDDLLRIV